MAHRRSHKSIGGASSSEDEEGSRRLALLRPARMNAAFRPARVVNIDVYEEGHVARTVLETDEVLGSSDEETVVVQVGETQQFTLNPREDGGIAAGVSAQQLANQPGTSGVTSGGSPDSTFSQELVRERVLSVDDSFEEIDYPSESESQESDKTVGAASEDDWYSSQEQASDGGASEDMDATEDEDTLNEDSAEDELTPENHESKDKGSDKKDKDGEGSGGWPDRSGGAGSSGNGSGCSESGGDAANGSGNGAESNGGPEQSDDKESGGSIETNGGSQRSITETDAEVSPNDFLEFEAIEIEEEEETEEPVAGPSSKNYNLRSKPVTGPFFKSTNSKVDSSSSSASSVTVDESSNGEDPTDFTYRPGMRDFAAMRGLHSLDNEVNMRAPRAPATPYRAWRQEFERGLAAEDPAFLEELGAREFRELWRRESDDIRRQFEERFTRARVSFNKKLKFMENEAYRKE